MWGFNHSTLVTVPFSETGLLESNSAAKEWWANIGTAPAMRKAATAATIYSFIPDLPKQLQYKDTSCPASRAPTAPALFREFPGAETPRSPWWRRLLRRKLQWL